jgi:hypothetical protein
VLDFFLLIFIACPSDVTKNIDPYVCAANATWHAPTTSDNCGSVSLQLTGVSSGSAFLLGVSEQIYTVTDSSDRTASCSFFVTIEDRQKPVIGGFQPLNSFFPSYFPFVFKYIPELELYIAISLLYSNIYLNLKI